MSEPVTRAPRRAVIRFLGQDVGADPVAASRVVYEVVALAAREDMRAALLAWSLEKSRFSIRVSIPPEVTEEGVALYLDMVAARFVDVVNAGLAQAGLGEATWQVFR